MILINSLELNQIQLRYYHNKAISMMNKGTQLESKHIAQYIFQLKSLNSIERSLQLSINQRFKTKIHFISLSQAKSITELRKMPLPQVIEEEISETYQKCTPSKSINKQMRMYSTAASKISNEHMDSPQAHTSKKSKLISKQKKTPISLSRLGMKIHYYNPMGQRLRV